GRGGNRGLPHTSRSATVDKRRRPECCGTPQSSKTATAQAQCVSLWVTVGEPPTLSRHSQEFRRSRHDAQSGRSRGRSHRVELIEDCSRTVASGAVPPHVRNNGT